MTGAEVEYGRVDVDDDEYLYLPGASIPVNRTAAVEVWDGALCAQVDPELFFPEPWDSGRAARRVCRACLVRELCLAVFGPMLSHGIVGGLTIGERQALRRGARSSGVA